jgi:quinoprotein glucose dehydrogenase
MKNALACLIIIALLVLTGCGKGTEKVKRDYTTWTSYLGDPARTHYSTLSQITPENVKDLKVAWSYAAPDSGQMQMNPIVIDTVLYGVTAALRIVALHAETGKVIWKFGDSLQVWHSTSRGVSYWENEGDKRLLFTRGPELFALNALNGNLIPTFGDGGKIDLHSGLPEWAREKFVISNTPGTIYKDLIVMPLRLSEDAGAAPGDIMAFNVITGEVAWTFHTIPYPDEEGYETWGNKDIYKGGVVGAANNWAGMALDEEREILYVPTGSAAPDFYGGVRKGSNLFANCLLALDANTGKRLWHFQFTHHDLWDRDLPAPPNLMTITRDGKTIPAVAQVTKQGYVFLFDRRTGEPLFDIEERSVPASSLKGEVAWKTQPFPVAPKPFARQSSELGVHDISPYADNPDSLRTLLQNFDKRIYSPPGLDPVLLFPGYDGAAEWGGAATHPAQGILYVNSNEMAWLLQMKKNDSITSDLSFGELIYRNNCAICHQSDRSGIAASGFPSLLNIKDKFKTEELSEIISRGKGMMTGFPQLGSGEKEALISFILNEKDKMEVTSNSYPPASAALPYKHKGYTKFLDSNGLPAISPPWGTLHAIDLNTGIFLWSVPFGETPELLDKGVRGTGTENYGGPVVTENGLLFIGATRDGYFRAFDRHTGKVLWEYKLPTAAFATPAMYEVDGKQYIAIACGGEKLGTEKGNQIIAFALE